jgi:hypothetical protein
MEKYANGLQHREAICYYEKWAIARKYLPKLTKGHLN